MGSIRNYVSNAIFFGVIFTSALMIWKALVVITGTVSPIVVIISGSMEPGFRRGDLLLLQMNKDPIRSGEIVVFNVNGHDIPIVHRAITVHERRETGEAYFLTKGDNNDYDDRGLYGQKWLDHQHIMGKAFGLLPYAGWMTILMNDYPIIKYLLIGAMGLIVMFSKD